MGASINGLWRHPIDAFAERNLSGTTAKASIGPGISLSVIFHCGGVT
jgi:hypothetical protein